MKAKMLALTMTACMIVGMIPVSTYAAECEHHTTHTAECGYEEGAEGSTCDYVCEICKEDEDDSTSTQLVFDEMVATLPAPESVDPSDEEMMEKLDEDIREIITYALENGLYGTQDDVTCHPVISELLEAMYPTDITAVATVNGEECETLEDALEKVKDVGGTIELLQDATLTGNYKIEKNVTINGNNHIVTRDTNGDKASSITVNDGVTMNINNLIIDGGYTFTFDAEKFKNDMNAANGVTQGGGVGHLNQYITPISGGSTAKVSMFTVNGTVNMNNTTIQNHRAEGEKKGFFEIKSTGKVALNGVNIHDCVFWSYGMIGRGAGKISFTDTKIYNNAIGGANGALCYISNPGGDNTGGIDISGNTVVENNYCYGSIGLFWFGGCTMNLNNATIQNNYFISADTQRLSVIHVYTYANTVFNMYGGTIQNNYGLIYGAIGGKGGGNDTPINLMGGTIQNNEALGGNENQSHDGVWQTYANGSLTIGEGMTIKDNIFSKADVTVKGTIIGDIGVADDKKITIDDPGKVTGKVSGDFILNGVPYDVSTGGYVELTAGDADHYIRVPAGTTVTFGEGEKQRTVEGSEYADVYIDLSGNVHMELEITLKGNHNETCAHTSTAIVHSAETELRNYSLTYGDGFQNTGYTLLGWFTAPSGGTKVINPDGTFIPGVDGYTDEDGLWTNFGEITLYAQWKADPTTLTQDADSNVPHTGDNAMPILWILMLLISVFGVIVVLMPKCKNGKYLR